MAKNNDKNFLIRDLVWAKMKGYPPWPGMIVEPSNAQSRKGYQFIQFYGTGDHSWISEKNIQHHSPALLSNIPKRKPKFFQDAVDKIVELYESCSPQTETTHSSCPYNEKSEELSMQGQDLPEQLNSSNQLSDKSVEKSPEFAKPAPKRKKLAKTVHDLELSQPLDSIGRSSPKKSRKRISNEVDIKIASRLSSNQSRFPTKHLMIGFIGINDLSCCIMKKLLQTGHKVMLWCDAENKADKCSEFEKLGVKLRKKPAGLGVACDVIFSCLSSSDMLHEAFFGDNGVLRGLQRVGRKKRQTGYVELTSPTDELALNIRDAIRINHGKYLRAEIISGSGALERGEIRVFISGDVFELHNASHVLNVVAAKVKFISDDIRNLKKLATIIRTFGCMQIVSLAENLKGVLKLGVEIDKYLGVLLYRGIITPFLIKKAFEMGYGEYQKDYTIREMMTDVNTCLDMNGGFPLNFTQLACCKDILIHAIEEGKEDEDIATVFDIL